MIHQRVASAFIAMSIVMSLTLIMPPANANQGDEANEPTKSDPFQCTTPFDSLMSRVEVWFAGENSRIRGEFRTKVKGFEAQRDAKPTNAKAQAKAKSEFVARVGTSRLIRDFYLRLTKEQYRAYNSAAKETLANCEVTGYWNAPYYAGPVVKSLRQSLTGSFSPVRLKSQSAHYPQSRFE